MIDRRRRQLVLGWAGAATAGITGCADVGSAPKRRLPMPRIAGFKGRLIERSSVDYDDWLSAMVWQMRKPERFPEFILRPNSVADISAAIKFAGRHQLKVSVRSGGHHIWAASVRDGGILLDLSQFRQHQIERPGLARFGPSLWARDVMLALEPHKQGFPVAHCATVPLGGYLLGGGMGLNGDEWGGMACNTLVGGSVITAGGELLMVSEKEHPELLWAMRGGSGALPFVVTEMTVKTFDRPPGAFTATYLYPLGLLESALDLLDQIEQLAPSNTELLALMLHNPSAPPDAPPEMQKAIAVRVQVYAASEQAAAPTLKEIAGLPAASTSVFRMGPLVESFEKLFVDSMDWRRGFGFGRFAVENAWVDNRREAVSAVADAYLRAPSWKSHVVIQPKLRKAVDGYGAFSRAAGTYIGLYSVWDEGVNDRQNEGWLRDLSGALDNFSVGHYVNEIDARNDQQRLQDCYSKDSWQTLRSLRRKWDPQNVLHDFPGMS